MIKKMIFLIFLISIACCTSSPDPEDQIRLNNNLIQALNNGNLIETEKLLNSGAVPDAEGPAGNPALIIAAKSGNVDLVELLLEYGADIDIRDSDGFTALMHSCLLGYYHVVELLIDSGADINLVNNDSESAFVIATQENQLEIIDLLIMSGVLDYVHLNNKLLEACFLGNYEEVGRLIDGGADVNARDDSGETVLMRAVYYMYSDIVELLIRSGADVNSIYPESGDTVLMNAVYKEYIDIIELLLKFGADPNIKNFSGDTALTWADRKEHKEIMELLVNYGADMQVLLNAKLINNCISGNLREIKNLIESGADINAANEESGWTPLMYAVNEGYRRIVEYLLDSGVDVHAIDNQGRSALDIADEKGYSLISSLLVDSGA